MSVSRHHADWLSLVKVSGPFVSLPVLLRVFPQGLEPRDPAQAKALRSAYAELHVRDLGPRTRVWAEPKVVEQESTTTAGKVLAQDVPADVTDAYQRLIAAGYDSRLMKE